MGEAANRQSIWALAGGKGGVGRSLLVANLGIQLARTGKRVVLVDLDLQGSNLQIYLGFQRLPRSLSDLAAGGVALLSELACETPIPHLRLIGGLQRCELREDPVAFVRRAAEQFATLAADHVLVDCGSGRSRASVAAFAEAHVGILVATPEPAALEAAYLFAEAHLRWCLLRALTGEAMAAIETRLRADGLDPARLSFRAFMTRVGTIDPAAREAIAALVRRTRLELLLNQVRGETDEEAAACLASGFRKCFGLGLHTAGIIEHDPAVLQAVQKRRSLSQQFPNSVATRGIALSASRLQSVSGAPPRESDEEWEDLEAIDHYRVLEVVPKASPKEVQTAYQLLKKAYDPETTALSPLIETAGLRDLQARIEAAYRTLIFLESRSDYDRRLLTRGTLRDDQVRGLHGTPPPGAAATPSLELAGGQAIAAGSAPPPDAVVPPEPPAEDAVPVAAPPVGETSPGPTPSSGSELRDERERRRLTLEVIAEKTKIRRTHLQAIEEERFADLPAPVFVRGFLREYARCLGLPGGDITRLYMKRYQDWQESRGQPHGAPGPFSNN
jgi:flagellar biosynthesis protein FlhG